MTNDPIAALEHARAVLLNRTASVAQLRDAAEQARGVVRGIDTESESAPQREARILAAMSPIAETLGALRAFADENTARALTRKIAVADASALDTRALDAVRADAAQAWERSPFAAYSTLAARACQLLVTDVTIRRLATNAYAQIPRGQSAAVGYRLGELPRTIATPRILSSMILPRFIDVNGNRDAHNFWPPPSGSDDEKLKSPSFEFEADADLVAELAKLSEGRTTHEAVDHALAKADAVLVSEFGKVITAIAELKARDALGRMESGWITLPSTRAHAMAAE
jgi:hypothetical protein